MKKSIVLLAVCSTFFACTEKKKDISQFAWLEGKWTGTINGADLSEVWASPQGGSIHGIAAALKGNDTVFSETMTIEQRGEDFFYIAVQDDNKGPTEFKFTGIKNDSLVFENPQHDFPQRIIYYRQSDDKIYACIDGVDDGTYLRVEFPYSKAK